MTPRHEVFDGRLPDIPTARQLRQLLEAIVSATGLHAISEIVVSVRNPDWSAFVMIAESHVSAHGNARQGHIDVFSCRLFGCNEIYKLIVDGLGGKWVHRAIERKAVE